MDAIRENIVSKDILLRWTATGRLTIVDRNDNSCVVFDPPEIKVLRDILDEDDGSRCVWEKVEPFDDEYWETQCGAGFVEEDEGDCDSYVFCPNCGRKINRVEQMVEDEAVGDG